MIQQSECCRSSCVTQKITCYSSMINHLLKIAATLTHREKSKDAILGAVYSQRQQEQQSSSDFNIDAVMGTGGTNHKSIWGQRGRRYIGYLQRRSLCDLAQQVASIGNQGYGCKQYFFEIPVLLVICLCDDDDEIYYRMFSGRAIERRPHDK